MKHRSGRGLSQVGSTMLLGVAAAISGCTRVSAPPPAADAAAAPTPSLTAEPEPPLAPTPLPAATPGEVPPVASAPASAAATAAAPNPWTTPHDCSKVEAPSSQRARALSTCKAKEEFRSFVAARQSCKAANECAIVPGACPFGCFVPAAKASVSEVTAKLNELGTRLDQTGDRCVYRCMAPPPEACVNGRCATGSL